MECNCENVLSDELGQLAKGSGCANRRGAAQQAFGKSGGIGIIKAVDLEFYARHTRKRQKPSVINHQLKAEHESRETPGQDLKSLISYSQV